MPEEQAMYSKLTQEFETTDKCNKNHILCTQKLKNVKLRHFHTYSVYVIHTKRLDDSFHNRVYSDNFVSDLLSLTFDITFSWRC